MKKNNSNRILARLAQNLREKHAELASWPKVSVACNVLTRDGRPNPGLAQRIALHDYDPSRKETRQRLGLPPVCIQCGRKVKRVRYVPDWLKAAVANLQALETKANIPPEMDRVYARGGMRIRVY